MRPPRPAALASRGIQNPISKRICKGAGKKIQEVGL